MLLSRKKIIAMVPEVFDKICKHTKDTHWGPAIKTEEDKFLCLCSMTHAGFYGAAKNIDDIPSAEEIAEILRAKGIDHTTWSRR